MELKKKVFTKLKAEAQAYGYKRDELMSVAAHIAGNLKLDDDASEEDVADAVDAAVEACVPFLKFGQSMATRIVNDAKQKNGQTDDDEGEGDGDDHQPEPKKSKKTSSAEETQAPAWAASMMKTVATLTEQIETLKGEKVASGRKERLSAILKDTGTIGDMTLKQFELMTFKDDEAFEDYLSGVEDYMATLKQQMADSGLSLLSTPPAPQHEKPKPEEKVFTDEELKKIADGF